MHRGQVFALPGHTLVRQSGLQSPPQKSCGLRSANSPMEFHKEHIEFSAVDMHSGWELPPGYTPESGAAQKILSGALDERGASGFRTRLLRFPAQFHTSEPFVHEYWEEVFLVTGDLWVGNDRYGNGGERFAPFTYACRPPGTFHGPFKSVNGCLLLELHYYALR